MVDQAAHLFVIGERRALAWVLTQSKMGFTKPGDARSLSAGDIAYIYTTRSCFGNPKVHRSRVIGKARVLSKIRYLSRRQIVGGHIISADCEIELMNLCPYGDGVDFAALVPRLSGFTDSGWATQVRRSARPLAQGDASILSAELHKLAAAPALVIQDYLTREDSGAASHDAGRA